MIYFSSPGHFIGEMGQEVLKGENTSYPCIQPAKCLFGKSSADHAMF